MTPFDTELRTALGAILEEPLPEPDGDDALLFFRQLLAGRNLGLVPIAEPAQFSWAGSWLARVRADDGEHAVVMYGSPSGPVLDPAGAFARGTVAEGWLLAPLDLRLPIDDPYGAPSSTGSVEAILVAPDAEGPLHRVDAAEAVPGRGLAGDRYFDGRGTFSSPGRGYELTLVQAEVLEELSLSAEEARRNVVTRGVDLNALVGHRFRIGDVECVGRRLAEPCAHLERLSRPGVIRPLVHRAGLRADILAGGTISVGDTVAVS